MSLTGGLSQSSGTSVSQSHIPDTGIPVDHDSPLDSDRATDEDKEAREIADIILKRGKNTSDPDPAKQTVPDGLECTLCLKDFPARQKLIDHWYSHHKGNTQRKCPWPKCEKWFLLPSKIQQHYNSSHKPFKLLNHGDKCTGKAKWDELYCFLNKKEHVCLSDLK